jgi:Domain of unknown function (DUF4376)
MILRNGQPFNIDSPWSDENGIQYPANWYRLATPEERAEKGFTEVPDPVPQDPRFYYQNSDGTWTQKPMNVCQDAVKSQLASVRWNNEVAGIVYANNVYSTDQQARVNYVGAYNQAKANSEYTVLWKTRTNAELPDKGQSVFVTLTANDIIKIVEGGTDYITKCFINEAAIINEINATTKLDDLIAVNLNTGWPQRTY